jgi:hypothetical protein
MVFRNNALGRSLLVIIAVLTSSCENDAAGTATLQVNYGAPVWIRVEGNICPALTVATKAGKTVATLPLETTCCNCGRALQQAVYRKIAPGTVLPLKWDGREFFTINTGDNCTPLRNETRPVVPGDYVGTIHWSMAAPVGANCLNTQNGDVACDDECEPTQTTQVPFTLRAGADTTVEVTLPPR